MFNDTDTENCAHDKSFSSSPHDLMALLAKKNKKLWHTDPDSNHDTSNCNNSLYYSTTALNTTMNTVNNNYEFSIINFNCRDLKAASHYDQFINILNNINHTFPFISVTETWLNNINDNLYPLHNYSFHNVGRNDKGGGGAGIYVHNSVHFKLLTDPELSSPYEVCHCIFIEASGFGPTNIILGVFYRTGHTHLKSFLQFFNSALSFLNKKHKNKSFVLTGDFNLNLLNHESNTNISEFLNAIISEQLFPQITYPTRISANSASLLDLILSNNIHYNNFSGILTDSFTDHYPVFHFCNFSRKNPSDNYPSYHRNFDLFQNSPSNISQYIINENTLNNLRAHLFRTDWTFLSELKSTEDKYSAFSGKLSLIVDKSLPKLKRNSSIGPKNFFNDQPWMTPGLKKSIYSKQLLYNSFLNSPTDVDIKNEYIEYNKKLKSLLRRAKRDFISSQLNDCKNNLKKTWNILNNLMGRSKHCKAVSRYFSYEGVIITEPIDIVEHFNSYFSSVGSKLASKIQNTDASPESFLSNGVGSSIYLHSTSPSEIIKIIKKMKSSYSTSFDNFSSKLVKGIVDLIADPLAHVFNSSLSDGTVPSPLKIAKVIPLFKSGDKSKFSNYRPISLLPTFSKILEKIVFYRLTSFLNKNNVLSPFQYGFRPGYSTEHALVHLIDKLSSNINDKKFTGSIFLDLSKAFDTVDHSILLRKLNHYGIRGIALKWFSNYLADRMQFCHYLDNSSSLNHISCGVPQGSILGPILFLIYINDLPNSSLLNFILFADDTTAFFSDTDPNRIVNVINQELTKLSLWFSCNKLSLNESKTHYMIFCPKRTKFSPDSSIISINGKEITKVSSTKFLGIHIEDDLKWNIQIHQVAYKLSKTTAILHKLKHFLNCDQLKHIYNSLFLPYLNYCSVVWGNTSFENLNRLILLQKKAVRILSNSCFLAHTAPLFQNLKILTVESLFKHRIAIFMFKHLKNVHPPYIKDMFSLVSSNHNICTRSSTKYFCNLPRTKFFQETLRFKGPSIFNSIPPDITSAKTLYTFKRKHSVYLRAHTE